MADRSEQIQEKARLSPLASISIRDPSSSRAPTELWRLCRWRHRRLLRLSVWLRLGRLRLGRLGRLRRLLRWLWRLGHPRHVPASLPPSLSPRLLLLGNERRIS